MLGTGYCECEYAYDPNTDSCIIPEPCGGVNEIRNPYSGLCDCFNYDWNTGDCLPGVPMPRPLPPPTPEDCGIYESWNPYTGLCECVNYDWNTGGCLPVVPTPIPTATYVSEWPQPTPSTNPEWPVTNCTSEWTGVIPVSKPGNGISFYRLIPRTTLGCTGNYTFSFQVYPADQPSEVRIINGTQHQNWPVIPKAVFPPGINGSTELYLDFNFQGIAGPSIYAINAWHAVTQDTYPETILQYLVKLGPAEYCTLQRSGPELPAPTSTTPVQLQGKSLPVTNFWSQKVGNVEMPYVIGAASRSVVLAAAFIGAFFWKRKARRKASRRVSTERGGQEANMTSFSQPDRPGIAGHISKSSLTRRQSRLQGSAAPTGVRQVWAQNGDSTNGSHVLNDQRTTIDIETMQELILESEQRQAELTRQLLAEQAAMYEQMLVSIVGRKEGDGGTQTRPQYSTTNRDATYGRRQRVEPTPPDLDEN